MSLGQETRWAYSTTLLGPHGAKLCYTDWRCELVTATL